MTESLRKDISELDTVDRDGLLMFQFWLSCAICNDILVIMNGKELEYHGSSTDEITLVNAADRFGVKLVSRTPTAYNVLVQGYGEMGFDVLYKIEFTSERKRMTTVV